MSISTRRSKLLVVLTLAISASLVLGGCGILGNAGSAPDDDGQYTSQGQALESDDGEADLPSDESGLEPVALACPSEVTEFVLFLSHNWDFSPNRDLEKMRVNGQTAASSPCPFSVAGSTVVMEECHVPITNTGFIQTDSGPCDITSSGEALISIEDASCDDGVITMTIVETLNPDGGSGAMNCPDTSEPYLPFFPFSRTTRSFPIKVGGSEASESVDPDMSGQFMYNKTWTVHGESMGSPLPED